MLINENILLFLSQCPDRNLRGVRLVLFAGVQPTFCSAIVPSDVQFFIVFNEPINDGAPLQDYDWTWGGQCTWNTALLTM